MKPRGLRRLLIYPGGRAACHSQGHRWITDRFVLGREDVFLRGAELAGGDGFDLRERSLRRSLAAFRAEQLLPGRVRATDQTMTIGDQTNRFIAAGAVCAAVCERVWRGWSETGLTPRMTVTGTVLWFLDRGNRSSVMVGAVMPVRPNSEAVQR